MKNINLIIFSIVLLILSLGFVSAGFFSRGITGNLVDNTPLNNSNFCRDSDGGVFSFQAGATAGVKVLSTGYYFDTCLSNNNSLKEYYCNFRGRLAKSTINCPGGCESVQVEFEGQTKTAGRCIPLENSCVEIDGGVKDEKGKKFFSGCDKNNNLIYETYSCNGTSILRREQNCTLSSGFGKCTPKGCIGDCTETDVENDINVAGIVTVDGKDYFDTCSTAKNSVKQYKCVNGKVRRVSVSHDNSYKSCGLNRECVLNGTGAGYCKDKYIGEETIERLNKRLTDLETTVSRLIESLNALGPSEETIPETIPEE